MEKKEFISKIKSCKNIDWLEIKYSQGSNPFSKFGYPDDDLGEVQVEDSYGGEGMGDSYWVVVKFLDHNLYVRVDGWYASYDGGYLDGAPYLVKPVEKSIVIYERDNDV